MPTKKTILILVDYRNQFWLKANYKEENFDLPRLQKEFEKHRYNVEIQGFSQINLKNKNYKNTFVIYQSSEDPNHFYKSYIEDCLLGLKLKGAILIPDFQYFRAHDNKVFMEILRDVNTCTAIKSPISEYFGAFEEYLKSRIFENANPKVFKLAAGAQSKNVFLLKSKKDFLKIPQRTSKSINLYYWIIDQIKPFLNSRYPFYVKKSHNRRKFILQNFVPDLDGDFKVLVYGSNYYVLSRKIRPNDFRASGSGLFQYTKDLPKGLLAYAKKCFEAFNVPFMGLDIAEKGGVFYLIEFQFVHFGNYTLEKSPFHFKYEQEEWHVIDTTVVLEEEFALTVHKYIQNSFENSIHP